MPTLSLDSLVKSTRRRSRRLRRKHPVPIASPPRQEKPCLTKSATRVSPPYKNGDKWRLVIFQGNERKSMVLDTYEQALATREDLLGKIKTIANRTFAEAIDEYQQQQESREIKSAFPAAQHLRRFLPLEERLSDLLADRAATLYQEATQRKKPDGQLISPDTHHQVLRRTKQFYKWAVTRRFVDSNPFASVRPIGRPRRGKKQLRIDEARKFITVAIKHAEALEVGATATLIQIFLGLRPTEAVIREVRDLDDDGRVLWVPFGKTPNAKRRLQVPDVLRDILLKHAADKPPNAPLLGPPGEPMHTIAVVRFRLPALCDEAQVPRVCPHSLRGLNATLAIEAGATSHHVAVALGHASFHTTAQHYADSSAVANASLRKVAHVLTSRGSGLMDTEYLAKLLESHLTKEELTALLSTLQGKLCATR